MSLLSSTAINRLRTTEIITLPPSPVQCHPSLSSVVVNRRFIPPLLLPPPHCHHRCSSSLLTAINHHCTTPPQCCPPPPLTATVISQSLGISSFSPLHPPNLINIFLEFGACRLGNSECSYVACLVVAVDEAFAMDPPAGAHEGGAVPFGAVPKLRLQSLLSFN